MAHHRCRCPGSRRGKLVSPSYVRRVRRFVRFLAESGVAEPSAARRILAERLDRRGGDFCLRNSFGLIDGGERRAPAASFFAKFAGGRDV